MKEFTPRHPTGKDAYRYARLVCKRIGISLYELSARTGIANSTFQRWKNGTVKEAGVTYYKLRDWAMAQGVES